MMPYTVRMDPELVRFLARTFRGVALVAVVFSAAVAAVLVANYAQVAALSPRDSPALAALRERYRADPDHELAREIRALDLAARRTWFTRQWQIRTAAIMLATGALVALVSVRVSGALGKGLPRPIAKENEGKLRPGRVALALTASVLLAAGLTAAVLNDRWLRAAGGPDTTAPVADLARTGNGPGVVDTEAYRDNWPQFRGPGGNGLAAAQDPPVDWDGSTGRNILWKTPVPLPGFGSPVVWNDRVFLTGADGTRLEAYCWDAGTGDLRWSATVPTSRVEAPIVTDAGWAGPTPVVNGEAVFAVFATGTVVSLDFEGRIRWTRELGAPQVSFGYATSPALYGDTLILQLDEAHGGRLVGLDTATGATAWTADRAVLESWCSPVVVRTPGGWRVFLGGTPCLSAADPDRGGRELWTLPGMVGQNASSPAYADGRVFFSNELLCLTAADAETGDKLWEVYDDFPNVSSPLAADGLVVMATSYGVVSCLDAEDGALKAQRVYDTGFYASPILAGGRVYTLDRSGAMRIHTADRAFALVASPTVGEPTDATPAFREGRIYIRGQRTLFCVGDGHGTP